MDQKEKILVIIPARAGSKRIPNKNIRNFLGKPLIAYTIEQALAVQFANRVIVDTDSSQIAKIATRYGAEVPFLRPTRLARDDSLVADSIIYTLRRLKKEEGYMPTHVIILQSTSPLREIQDIKNCWQLMKSSNATTVLTICPTHPKLYHLGKNNKINLVNGNEAQSSNMQAWKPGYILNGCFVYIIKTDALLKRKGVITKNTKAVVCPRWRSVDLDTPEEWVLAKFLYKNRKKIYENIKRF